MLSHVSKGVIVILQTLDRGSFGQDGDGSIRHCLLLDDRWDLGAPAVRAHPQKMTRLIVPLGRIQDSSADVKNDQLHTSTSISHARTLSAILSVDGTDFR